MLIGITVDSSFYSSSYDNILLDFVELFRFRDLYFIVLDRRGWKGEGFAIELFFFFEEKRKEFRIGMEWY